MTPNRAVWLELGRLDSRHSGRTHRSAVLEGPRVSEEVIGSHAVAMRRTADIFCDQASEWGFEKSTLCTV